MKHKIFSLILALALTLSGVNAMAATADTIDVEISPENYATVYVTQHSDNSSRKTSAALAAYYNTLYPTKAANLNAQHVSIISTYQVPYKVALSSMSVGYTTYKGAMSGRNVPIFYNLGKFELDAANGTYAGPTDETEVHATYTEVMEFINKYWPADNGYSSANAELPVANKITNSNTTANLTRNFYAASSDALTAFQTDTNTDYITFATGRASHKDSNMRYRMGYTTQIPTLKLSYVSADILNAINSATEADMPTVFENLNKAGMFNATIGDKDVSSSEGYAAFTARTTEEQAEICTTLANTDFATFDGFITVYDLLLSDKNEDFAVYDITLTSGDTVYSELASAVGQTVDVKAFTINAAPSTLVSILGAYDANGRLLTAEVANSGIEFSLTIPENTSTIKLMCWDSIDNREPVCDAVSK